MKASTLENRINKNLTTKSGSLRKDCESIIELFENGNIHPFGYSGSGRCVTKAGSFNYTALDAMKIDYITGNDAPRGGHSGNYIELTAKGKRQVKDWLRLRKEYSRKLQEHATLVQSFRAANSVNKAVNKAIFIQNMPKNSSDDVVLREYFNLEVHPAPAEVMQAKANTGMSWGDLRIKYSN